MTDTDSPSPSLDFAPSSQRRWVPILIMVLLVAGGTLAMAVSQARALAREALAVHERKGRVLAHLRTLQQRVNEVHSGSRRAIRELNRLQGFPQDTVTISSNGEFTLVAFEIAALEKTVVASRAAAVRLHREGAQIVAEADLQQDAECRSGLQRLAPETGATRIPSVGASEGDSDLAVIMYRCGLSETSMEDHGLRMLVQTHLAQIRIFDNTGLPRTDPGRIAQEERSIQEILTYKTARGL